MVGWHHWVNGLQLEQTLGDSEVQGCLACCSPWGCKELDTTERLNNNNQVYIPLQPHPIKMWLLGRTFPGSGFAFFSFFLIPEWLFPAILIPCSLLKAIYLLHGLWISCWLPCTRMSLRKKTVWKLRSLEHSLTEDCCFLGPIWLQDPVNSSTPGFPVPPHLLEFAQVHVLWISDAIQPSYPLLLSSPS